MSSLSSLLFLQENWEANGKTCYPSISPFPHFISLQPNNENPIFLSISFLFLHRISNQTKCENKKLTLWSPILIAVLAILLSESTFLKGVNKNSTRDKKSKGNSLEGRNISYNHSFKKQTRPASSIGSTRN